MEKEWVVIWAFVLLVLVSWIITSAEDREICQQTIAAGGECEPQRITPFVEE